MTNHWPTEASTKWFLSWEDSYFYRWRWRKLMSVVRWQFVQTSFSPQIQLFFGRTQSISVVLYCFYSSAVHFGEFFFARFPIVNKGSLSGNWNLSVLCPADAKIQPLVMDTMNTKCSRQMSVDVTNASRKWKGHLNWHFFTSAPPKMPGRVFNSPARVISSLQAHFILSLVLAVWLFPGQLK